MNLIDFSSALNTIIPQHLLNKLAPLGLGIPQCNWLLDFLTNRPQGADGKQHLQRHLPEHRLPKGCVLSPLLFTLMTHDCCARFSTNHIVKNADNTTVVGLISDDEELVYREKVRQLVKWCNTNNLVLNVD